jgi:hypothetical protein
MLLHQATLSYVRGNPGDMVNAVTYLNWISRISASTSGFQSSLTLSQATSPTPAEVSDLNSQVVGLLSQLSAGLDFYGLPYDFVPTLTKETYENLADKWISVGIDVETQIQQLFQRPKLRY